MDSKLNYELIKKYSSKYSKTLLDRHFSHPSKITGSQLLELSNIKQINLFVVKKLFAQWRSEVDKMKSPYFDYDAKEVKESLINFQNTLSRHISIDREGLEPLLLDAVTDTLLIILSPYHFYYNVLNENEEVDVKSLKSSKKFIKINTAIYHTLIEKIEKVSVDKVSAHTATDLLNHILEETDVIPEDVNEYVLKLNEIASLNIEDIYNDGIMEESPKDEFIEESEFKSNIESSKKQTEETIEVNKNDEIDTSESGQSREQEIDVVGQDDISQSESRVTINDTYQRQDQRTIADLHLQQKISSIENAVTLNQRFMFVNTLFGGDIDLFNKTINKLDAMDQMSDADEYLKNHFKSWDSEEDDVKEFMGIIIRRFD